MQPLEKLIDIDHRTDLPVYLQISNAFTREIRRGRLRKGTKLPGSREAAALLKINRMTMVAAYDELQAQGWIEKMPRKGTFVKRDLPEIKPEKIPGKTPAVPFSGKAAFPIEEKGIAVFPASDFPDTGKLIINDGFPDIRLAPVEALIRSMRRLSRQGAFKKYLMYGNPRGARVLCETMAAFLSDTRGIPVSEKNLLITRGAQMGIYLATRLLIRPGDDIIVGEPGYLGANITFRQNGAVINRVPVDEQGMDTDAVAGICKKKKVRLLYVIPHHHHPTTVTLTPERRIRLLELAAEYRFAIVEDDYDYDFHYARNPVLPMASIDDQGSVIYIGTLAKTLAPAIRVGFMTGAGNLIRAVSNLRKGIDWQGDSLLEAAVAELYQDGTITRHIKKSVRLYRERRDHFCRLLQTTLGEEVAFQIPEGGMSVWTQFKHASLEDISRKAYKKGLVISDGKEYNTHTRNYNAARLGFASLDFAEQERAVAILSACF